MEHPERNQRLADAWRRGEGAIEIAEREGMTPTAVVEMLRRLRRDYGWDIPMHRRQNRELWPQIEKLWNEGATLREIAQEFDTTPSNIQQMVEKMRKNGINVPPRRPRREP